MHTTAQPRSSSAHTTSIQAVVNKGGFTNYVWACSCGDAPPEGTAWSHKELAQEMADLHVVSMPPLVISEDGHWADYVERYPYYGEFGDLAFYKVRYKYRKPPKPLRTKTFRYHPKGVKDDALVYRLPELLEAIRAGEPRVFIVEGEKDADTAAEYGLFATTAHQGGGPGNKVTLAQARWFTGYSGQVWVVADNDVTGYATAWRWYQLLLKVGLSEAQLRPCRARTGKDLTDHLRAGRAVAGLRRLTLEDLRRRAGTYSEEGATREGYGLWLKRAEKPVRVPRQVRRWMDLP